MIHGIMMRSGLADSLKLKSKLIQLTGKRITKFVLC